MKLYRAISNWEALKLFQNGMIVEPYEFQGSTDSTCPAGSVVSFWWDKPYKWPGRAGWAVASTTPTGEGIMQYSWRPRDYNGDLLPKETVKVPEFYLDHPVKVKVITEDDSSWIYPGGDHFLKDDWKRDLESAKETLDLDFFGSLSPEMETHFIPIFTPELSSKTKGIWVEFWDKKKSGYYSLNCIKDWISQIEKYMKWWDSFPIIEGDHL
jgi:hypothetical protein